MINMALHVYTKHLKKGDFVLKCVYSSKRTVKHLQNVPKARVVYVLLHEMSYIYNIAYIAILQGVNLPHPSMKNRGKLNNSVIIL